VQKLKWITILALWFAASSLLAEAAPQVTNTKVVDARNAPSLDAQKEKRAFESLLNLVEKEIVSTVDAMPADKFGFAPTDGEFKGVRTFGQMVKHFSATNHILAAAALGEEPPAEAGDELGPENVRTKAEILAYLKGSFVHLDKAVEAIGQTNIPVNASPISPLKRGEVTRLALITETLLHAYDHYGQMVEYLRMNGVVPPASRP
jgi:DinB superfamily